MKLIVGLGNIGDKYKNNRHNIGFEVLDKLQIEISKSEFLIFNQIPNPKFQFQKKFNAEILKLGDVILAKPSTFMNKSGLAVKTLASFFNVQVKDIWVVHDDLDLRLGEYKIQLGVGPKLHYGVSSIEENLRSNNFWRVRVGVDNRDPNIRTSGEKYVLENFSKDEMEIRDRVIDKLLIDLINLISE